MNHICHIEIPADNVGQLQGFYSSLFGWNFEKMPGDFEYYNVKHGEEAPMAGMMARQHPEQTPIFYVCVESIDAALERAHEQHATVCVPKTAVKGYGWFAVISDPQKNPVGLWESNESAI
ncbi:MAG: VOC family protein [Desulfomonile tiedjei]|uniref:VOC family protein n=1 Tax=Desulfomonile tiedjei TaxID=2358 RepID=A0A9D6UXZ3_9BACT|nr:VOC family protein [Desulfomonile tiedjei]